LIPPDYVACSANVWALDPILAGLPVGIVILVVGSLIEWRIKENKEQISGNAV
jgi:hypothetical protein